MLLQGFCSKNFCRNLRHTEDLLGIPGVPDNLSAHQSFGAEFFAAFALVLVVFAVAADENNRHNVSSLSAPLTIGLTVGVAHLAFVPFSGCGMNPARSLGPAVIMGQFDDHWVKDLKIFFSLKNSLLQAILKAGFPFENVPFTPVRADLSLTEHIW